MDRKKMRKPELEQRRGDVKPADRGDVKRVLRIPKKKVDNETQVESICLDDRGDSTKQGKKKFEECSAKKLEETNARRARNTNNRDQQSKQSERNLKRIYEKMNMSVKPLDIASRRKLNEMYTFRKPSEETQTLKEEKVGKYIRLDLTEKDVLQITKPNNQSSKDRSAPTKYESVAYWTPDTAHVESLSSPMTTPQTQTKHRSGKQSKRKPIIKTVMQKGYDSTKFYKAVSFVNQENKSPLNIRMDRHHESTKSNSTPSQKSKTDSWGSAHSTIHSAKVKTTNSPTNVNNLTMSRRSFSKGRRKRTSSPQSKLTPAPVPAEEKLAKWAPSSVNDHTKPYYEAWVDTTLAAISKDDEKLMREKLRIIQSMRDRMKEYNNFPTSDEDFSDEKYTGRIKVNHR